MANPRTAAGRSRFSSCVRCGSQDLHMQTLADGLVPEGGETLRWVCAACGWQGQPVEFDTVAALREFQKAEGLRTQG